MGTGGGRGRSRGRAGAAWTGSGCCCGDGEGAQAGRGLSVARAWRDLDRQTTPGRCRILNWPFEQAAGESGPAVGNRAWTVQSSFPLSSPLSLALPPLIFLPTPAYIPSLSSLSLPSLSPSPPFPPQLRLMKTSVCERTNLMQDA